MSSPAYFHQFALLPTELRLETWRHACHPRLVEIRYDSRSDQCSTPGAAAPPLLRVCRESRREALRVYRRLFGTRTHGARIYFCPWLDTLYLPRPGGALGGGLGYDDASRSFPDRVRDAAAAVAHLAIDYVDPAVQRPWETYNKYVLMQSFPRAAEVFLILKGAGVAEEGAVAKDSYQLADPVGDHIALSQLLSRVEASFIREVGGLLEEDDDESDESDEGWGGAANRFKMPALVLKLRTRALQRLKGTA